MFGHSTQQKTENKGASNWNLFVDKVKSWVNPIKPVEETKSKFAGKKDEVVQRFKKVYEAARAEAEVQLREFLAPFVENNLKQKAEQKADQRGDEKDVTAENNDVGPGFSESTMTPRIPLAGKYPKKH